MRAGSSTIDGRVAANAPTAPSKRSATSGSSGDVGDRLVEPGGGERRQPHLADGGDLGFGETGGGEGDDRLAGTTRQRPDETDGQRLPLRLELVRQVLVEARHRGDDRRRRRHLRTGPLRRFGRERRRQRERLERSGELAPRAAELVVAVEPGHARVRHDRRVGRRCLSTSPSGQR